jgi:hypothetical protein
MATNKIAAAQVDLFRAFLEQIQEAGIAFIFPDPDGGDIDNAKILELSPDACVVALRGRAALAGALLGMEPERYQAWYEWRIRHNGACEAVKNCGSPCRERAGLPRPLAWRPGEKFYCQLHRKVMARRARAS